jgi:hypothetical protein
MTDLHALVSERCAAKIAAGRRPSRADLEWLEATRERSQPSSSVELSRNAKGETQISVKVADAEPLVAEATSQAIFERQRALWPMSDGTVGAPMSEPPTKAQGAAA